MSRVLTYIPRVAIFLAGIAAGALTSSRKERSTSDPAATEELKTALAGLEARLATRESVHTERFTQIEARLEEHAAKLAEVPSTSEIVAAMEQLLAKTISGFDIEICLVESNSTDGTRDDVLGYARHPQVRLLLEDKPSGKGHAVRKGLELATGDVVLIRRRKIARDFKRLIEKLCHFPIVTRND